GLEEGQPDDRALRTVGLDVGSTPSHAMFARLRLQRLADSLSSRYVVGEREVLHRSPIVLTPYSARNAIDAAALQAHIAGWYASAGLAREDVDTGAVILTGTAVERENARQLADLFAGEGGKFVCATAGHTLEATLAAHGSGSVARSRRDHEAILHLDVGGGTTKLARIEDGVIVATTAIGVGARSRIAGRDPAERKRIAGELADAIVAATRGAAVPTSLQLLATLPRAGAPGRITVSGGVSEYLAGRERADYDDLGRELADAIDGDIAATLGAILRDELRFKGDLVTLDGLELGDLDYIDVGTPLAPSGVVPVIVKSLVFQEEH